MNSTQMNNKLQYWIELNRVKLFYKSMFFQMKLGRGVHLQNYKPDITNSILNQWSLFKLSAVFLWLPLFGIAKKTIWHTRYKYCSSFHASCFYSLSKIFGPWILNISFIIGKNLYFFFMVVAVISDFKVKTTNFNSDSGSFINDVIFW